MNRRLLVPLVSGALIGLVLGLRVKDLSTSPDLGDGWGLLATTGSLLFLALVLAVVGLGMLIARRTRHAGIGLLIGVLAWGGGFWSGERFGPPHPPRVASMQVVIDGPSPMTWNGSADCVRPDPDGGGLGVSWVSGPLESEPWMIGDQPINVSVIYGRPTLDRPSVEFFDAGSVDELIWASDEIDDDDVWHQAWDDTEIQGDGLTGRTSGTVRFAHIHGTGRSVVGGVPIPDDISGHISWECSA